MCQHSVGLNEQMEPADNNTLELNKGEPVGSLKSHLGSPEKRTKDGDVPGPNEAPSVNPTIQLTPSNSFASDCSEQSVVVYTQGRHNVEENGSRGGQDDPRSKSCNGHVTRSTLEDSVNGRDRPDIATDNHRERKNDFIAADTSEEDKKIQHDEEEIVENPTSNDKVGPEIWIPPEAENDDDNFEHSVAALDEDDDECSDGTNWGNPSSLSSFEGGVARSYRFQEEKRKAMEEVKNGRFRCLVSQLLNSIGVPDSNQNGESWVNIVTHLAWQAASYVKPDATEGKAMDPAGYVKIKCIATGSRTESQLVKGLVFKKHAAHKHMPTKYKNPRLLLIQGMLGQSSGLSSFNSMILPQPPTIAATDPVPEMLTPNTRIQANTEKEIEDLKPLLDNLEACQPNVVLVEKSASRAVVEAILKKGFTLVFDMKLHRLERVARCIGSPILFPDALSNQKLKQCDLFHFEKFVEEHTLVGDGGKKPCKTLMFLEGFPTRLGCTILLKGSHSDELKRIKCVLQGAVVMAYHFILETSFLVDQKAMFSTIAFGTEFSKQSAAVVSVTSNSPDNSDATVHTSAVSEVQVPILNGYHEPASKIAPISSLDIPISDGHKEGVSCEMNTGLEGKSTLCYAAHPSSPFPGLPSLSASLKKVFGDNLYSVSPTAYESMSSYFGFNDGDSDAQTTTSIPISPTEEGSDPSLKPLSDRSENSSAYSEAATDAQKAVSDGGESIQNKDNISSVLDSESILVLISSRNGTKGSICKQSHFSHIKFYRSFDVPLGKFLRDNLLNQSIQCETCHGLPNAHIYYYAHHNKQLTIRVNQLKSYYLPGESEGKLWMWSQCGKCRPGSNDMKSKRVLISSAARGLSFGKFLELSFSNDSSFSRPANCGHSLPRDFLYFFGLGPMVAMFEYSRVATYTLSVPSLKVEFNNPIKGEWLQNEIELVHNKGVMLFTEIANYLKKMEPRISSISLKPNGPMKEFAEIEEMLRFQRSEFEEIAKNMGIKDGNSHHAVHKLLSLNRLRWVILLEACIWDQRLHSLLSSTTSIPNGSAPDQAVPEQNHLNEDHKAKEEVIPAGTNFDKVQPGLGEDPSADEAVQGGMDLKEDQNTQELGSQHANANTEVEVEIITNPEMICEGSTQGSEKQEALELPIAEDNIQGRALENSAATASVSQDAGESERFESDEAVADGSIPITLESEDGDSLLQKKEPERTGSPPVSNSESSGGWMWRSGSDMIDGSIRDRRSGHLVEFSNLLKLVSLHSPEFLPTISQVITEEGSRLHIPLNNGQYVVSDYEGEISSIVACALALMKDILPLEEDQESSLKRAVSEPSSNWFSRNSSEVLDVFEPAPSLSSLQSRFSSFDGLNLLDMVTYGQDHPEVTFGVDLYSAKGKYSVVCMYAREFFTLRDRCCPSELDYIASLSRCKTWNAKGGKSKSFFAKTLDDRLIIKEIKRTELESFMRFAPRYFKHMNESFDSGNQTCLAKILGIYQVTIRQTKTGRETKHDLMVQENLSFGRNITRQYDLKGALRARFTAASSDDPGDVRLDQNFVNDMNETPLYIRQRSKRLLQRAVYNDTIFLQTINVMDYSLLVGVDKERRELVCGIIDYLREYTWDKQLENWVKTSLVFPKSATPTIISPVEYKVRFRKFMDNHFMTVPDHWCSQRSLNPCKLCGIKGHDPSQQKPEKREEPNGKVHDPSQTEPEKTETPNGKVHDPTQTKPEKRDEPNGKVHDPTQTKPEKRDEPNGNDHDLSQTKPNKREEPNGSQIQA